MNMCFLLSLESFFCVINMFVLYCKDELKIVRVKEKKIIKQKKRLTEN